MIKKLLVLCLLLGGSAEAASLSKAEKLTSAQPFGGQWIVILGSFTEPGKLPEKLNLLEKHPDLAERLARIPSMELKSLMPCYEVVVAGGYKTKKEAKKVWKRLKKIGVDSYFKRAGKWVGRQKQVERYCERWRKKPAASCGSTHWIETVGKKVFMKLRVDKVVVDRAAPSAKQAKPVNGDVSAWSAPLKNVVLGDYRKKDPYVVWSASSDAPVGDCSIQRFTLLTIGTPHFGYTESPGAKKRPGCGSPEAYAELSCKGSMVGGEIAVPKKDAAVVYLKRNDKADFSSVIATLKKGRGFTEAKKRAQGEANQQKAKLVEKSDGSIYAGKKNRVGLVRVVLLTGEGNTMCGAEDVNITLVGVVSLDAKNQIQRILRPLKMADESTIRGVFQLNGKMHYLDQVFPNTRRLVPLEKGESCETSVAYCDCPC